MNPGILTPPTQFATMPRGLLGRPVAVSMPGDPYAYDADALGYIQRVEAADGAPLEPRVRTAFNSFVQACKANGVWDSITDCCILCGARSLAGCLQPLKGATPTNFNFVSGDYARGGATPGLRGNGTSKYLWTNRQDAFFNPNNAHLSVFVTDIGTVAATSQYIGSAVLALLYGGNLRIRPRVAFNAGDSAANLRAAGFIGASRNAYSVSYTARGNAISETIVGASALFGNITVAVLARNGNGGEGAIDIYSNGRVSFYSLGAGVDLILLDRLVSQLMSDVRAAIP
jgi:hypothetical protein